MDDTTQQQINLLKSYRATNGWSQPQASAACGVPVSTWRGWEAGKPMPQQAFILRLLRQCLQGVENLPSGGA